MQHFELMSWGMQLPVNAMANRRRVPKWQWEFMEKRLDATVEGQSLSDCPGLTSDDLQTARAGIKN